jgi:hypothetical protein
MKTLKAILTILLAFFLFADTQAQEVKDLQIVIEKATGKISLLDKNNQTPITLDFKVQLADVDIYKKNEYVGSLQLNNGQLSTNELKPEETLKAVHIQLVITSNNKILDFKEVNVSLK